jgi:hypothetical protein
MPRERQLVVGVKIRVRRSAAASRGGSTNVVSDRFVQCAKRCIASVSRPVASSTTATGLPLYGPEAKTSTWAKGRSTRDESGTPPR